MAANVGLFMYKKFLLISLMSILFFTGCENENNILVGEAVFGIENVDGKIVNWEGKSDRVLLFGYGENEIFGAAKISREGRFDVNLTNPDDDILTPINLFPEGGVSTNTLKYSKSGIKAIVGSFFVYEPGNAGPLGQIYRFNIPLGGEISSLGTWFSVQFIYVSDNVNISGREVCLYNFDKGEYFSITQDVNLKLVKGWNKIIYRSVENSTNASSIEVSNIEPTGGNWYYDAL